MGRAIPKAVRGLVGVLLVLAGFAALLGALWVAAVLDTPTFSWGAILVGEIVVVLVVAGVVAGVRKRPK